VVGHDDSCFCRPIVWRGTSLDNLVQQPTATLDSSFTTANGDSYWWPGGGWVDSTGTWYIPTHVEFSFKSGFAPFKRIGLSTSTDHGLNWHYVGDLLTSDNSYNRADFNNYFEYGSGEPRLFVDSPGGYFYLYYFEAWWSTTDSAEYSAAIRVARSPISAKMAPGTWNLFYKGTWTEPGLGGRSSDLLPNGSGLDIVYSTYLNKYLLITSKLYSGHDIDGAYMATATDLSQQNWSNFHLLSATADHYQDISNADGTATGTVGQTMRWYNFRGTNPGTGTYQYRTDTFGAGNQAADGMAQQHYPRLSVVDSNPYWDWNATPRPANFSLGSLAGWKTYNGSWSASGGVFSVDSGAGNRAAMETSWFDDLTFDADVRISDTSGNAGIVFRSANNDYGVDNYRGYYAGFSGSQLMLGRADNSCCGGVPTWTQLATAPIAATANGFYDLRVVAHSARIRVFFNYQATPSIDLADTANSFGGIGLRTYNTAASFAGVSSGGYRTS
jgi:hypothetical protein